MFIQRWLIAGALISAPLAGCTAGPNLRSDMRASETTAGSASRSRVDPMQGADTGGLASDSTRVTGTGRSVLETESATRDAESHDDMVAGGRSDGSDEMTADARAAGTDPMQVPVPSSADSATRESITSAEVAPTVQGPADVDTEITRQVEAAVGADARLSVAARNVVITTEAGVVTLRGNVSTARDRARIDAHAHSVQGVSRVDDQIRIIH